MSELRDGAPCALHTQNVSKSFDELRVLVDINFKVHAGEFVAVVGPNGAGKTTWCNIVTGFLPQTSGTVLLNGREVDALRSYERYRAGITRTFQTPRVIESLTLEENVAVAVPGPRGKAISRAREFLRALDVEQTDVPGSQASLYQRRVVELGRAAVNTPDVVILDEPLAGLRQPEHQAILGLARRLTEAGTAVVIVEHLIPAIAREVDRMVVFAKTVVIGNGKPRDVLNQQEVIDSYLGQPVKDEVIA